MAREKPAVADEPKRLSRIANRNVLGIHNVPVSPPVSPQRRQSIIGSADAQPYYEHMSDKSNAKSSAAVDSIPKTYAHAVRTLAAAHAAGPDRVDIYSLPDPQQQIVRLIEVSEAFPEGGVERRTPSNGFERIVPVFPMGPARDFPFRSEIVQITPAEWDALRQGKLKLNREWGDLSLAQKVNHGE